MNINELKENYEKELAESELYLSQLDRMAQECFNSLKRRCDEDMETWTQLFITLTSRESRNRDNLKEKLGVNSHDPAL